MNTASRKLTVTAVMHDESGIITAFFNELPALVVQGKDDEDIKRRLKSALNSYIRRLELMSSDFEIKTESLA